MGGPTMMFPFALLLAAAAGVACVLESYEFRLGEQGTHCREERFVYADEQFTANGEVQSVHRATCKVGSPTQAGLAQWIVSQTGDVFSSGASQWFAKGVSSFSVGQERSYEEHFGPLGKLSRLWLRARCRPDGSCAAVMVSSQVRSLPYLTDPSWALWLFAVDSRPHRDADQLRHALQRLPALEASVLDIDDGALLRDFNMPAHWSWAWLPSRRFRIGLITLFVLLLLLLLAVCVTLTLGPVLMTGLRHWLVPFLGLGLLTMGAA